MDDHRSDEFSPLFLMAGEVLPRYAAFQLEKEIRCYKGFHLTGSTIERRLKIVSLEITKFMWLHFRISNWHMSFGISKSLSLVKDNHHFL